MASHTIRAERSTVHGYFSCDLEPVLTIDSGDTITFDSLDAGWHRDPDPETGRWEHEQRVPWYEEGRDTGHALTGPVYVTGARPGLVLEIAIEEILTGTWGWTIGGGFDSDFNQALGLAEGTPEGDVWTLDPVRGVATSRERFQIDMRPFLGVLGMPPDVDGIQPTRPPRLTGGNIDCKELVAGTKLYLPVAVEGALFSAGDGHAVQADGEMSGVAIECPIQKATLRLTVREDLPFKIPHAWTPDAWITLGFDEDLDQATFVAIDAMLDLLAARFAISRARSISLASLAVDLRVTQIVNGAKGVHAVFPHDAISRLEP